MNTSTAAAVPHLASATPNQLHSMPEAARRLGISLPKFKLMALSNEIATVKIGRRRLVAESSLEDFIAKLVDRRGSARDVDGT